MLVAETRMVRRDFQILEMFSRCKLQVFLYSHRT